MRWWPGWWWCKPRCPETICGKDVDDVFAYPTTKFVRIRDARLGLFKIVLALGILGYVGLYELAYEGLYLEASAVTGAVRFTLQQPTVGGCDPTDAGCANAFLPTSETSYCAQSSATYAGTQYPCEYYENIGAQVVMKSALLVVTRQTTYDEELVCVAADETTCPRVYNITSQETTYVADAERYTVLVDHSVVAASLAESVARPSSKLKGRLYVKNSHSLCREYDGYRDIVGSSKSRRAPCFVAGNETSRNLDFFSLDVLLRAADISLDDINYGGMTYRETGTSLLLTITYQNFRPWRGKGEVVYSYTPDVVGSTSYKLYDTVYAPYRSARTLLNKHGIFIEAAQGGTLRGFSFNNLLLQLTTSLTLFAIATLVTDFAAIYILPDAKMYADYKYETTPDFSDLRRQDVDSSSLITASQQGGLPLLETTTN
ncbi:hypothetical protein CTAYLR_002801 [Chrysophaeum taylorii]|uniref:Uncharacterized protein n=1 Tax=Chrysophaeum taylorii TaxID=2483200 RepID=A0AAD7U8T5_9STRA|nr:hypothetical protein CTAYLR_002801 [Chrysophaeum taylorii]